MTKRISAKTPKPPINVHRLEVQVTDEQVNQARKLVWELGLYNFIWCFPEGIRNKCPCCGYANTIYVWREADHWQCDRCKANGDCIDYVMSRQRLDAAEAVIWILNELPYW